MNLEEAKNLKPGTIVREKNSHRRWKVNGKPKLWKTRPNEVKVPVKHGLYTFGYLTQDNIHLFELEV